MSIRSGAVLLVMCAPLVFWPGQGHARGDDDTSARGTCANGAEWRIEAKPDDGRIEIRAEIDSDITGQRWAWVLKHNGTLSARGTARTRGGGSFRIERSTVDVAGVDTFQFRATRNGSRCVATIRQ